MDFLNEVEKKLDLAPAEKEPVMREIRSHYYDLRDEYIASGMDTSQAEQEAARRMGNPADIAARLSATHNSASWKLALLCMVPFIGSALCFTLAFFQCSLLLKLTMVTISLLMAIGSVCELLKGRRPIWLSTWMAGAFLGLTEPIRALMEHHPLHLNANVGWDFSIITMILLAIMVLVLSFYYCSWRKISVTVGLLSIGLGLFMAYNPFMWFTVELLYICRLILQVLLARYIFEQHQYGNGAKASLCVLTLLILSLPQLNFVIFSHYKIYAAIKIIGSIVAALLVIWFARASKYIGKLLALWAALLSNSMISAIAIMKVTTTNSSTEIFLLQAVVTVLLGYIPVFIPILIYRRKNRPMAAD